MSDYEIQQQKSPAPWIAGGAVLGGGGAAALSNWGPAWAREAGKYKSFEDIVNDADDKFTKSMDGVDEKVKTKATEVRKAVRDVENMDVDKLLGDEKLIAKDSKVRTEYKKAEQEFVDLAKDAAEDVKKSKEDALNKAKEAVKKEAKENAIKSQKEVAAEELKTLWAKGGLKKGKFALLTGAGVVAGALLGAMFAPKKDTV